MSFAFATCDRKMALGFLKKLYPSHADTIADAENSVKDLLDIIEADELRICDPDYHSGTIIQSKNFKTDTTARAQKALEKSGLWFAKS